MPMVFPYTPENQKISDFLMFLRGIGKDWWHEISQTKRYQSQNFYSGKSRIFYALKTGEFEDKS